eukprot:8008099-Ditylum_brightwellii.AAC.1
MFAARPQIACEIIENKGGNDYLHEKRQQFGMHKCYVETLDGEGAIAVPESLEDGETIPDIVSHHR